MVSETHRIYNGCSGPSSALAWRGAAKKASPAAPPVRAEARPGAHWCRARRPRRPPHHPRARPPRRRRARPRPARPPPGSPTPTPADARPSGRRGGSSSPTTISWPGPHRRASMPLTSRPGPTITRPRTHERVARAGDIPPRDHVHRASRPRPRRAQVLRRGSDEGVRFAARRRADGAVVGDDAPLPQGLMHEAEERVDEARRGGRRATPPRRPM